LDDNTKKRQIACRLRIEQRMVDPITKLNYFEIFNKIAKFLQCKLLIRKQLATGNNYYHVTATSSNSLHIIFNYFKIYPLYSSKYLDYSD
jgi:LAGLIDADG endonuclease